MPATQRRKVPQKYLDRLSGKCGRQIYDTGFGSVPTAGDRTAKGFRRRANWVTPDLIVEAKLDGLCPICQAPVEFEREGGWCPKCEFAF